MPPMSHLRRNDSEFRAAIKLLVLAAFGTMALAVVLYSLWW